MTTPATIVTDYTPTTAVVLPVNSDDKLVIQFSIRQPIYDSAQPPCGKTILLSCSSEGIENLIDIRFQFTTCQGTYTQDDDNIDYELTPTDAPVTDIKIVVDKSILANKNYFVLYGVIAEEDLELITLAKGVVFCEINQQGEVVTLPSPEPELSFVDKEIPTGTIDGINTIFTLTDIPIEGTEYVYLNGLLQQVNNDYTIVDDIITMAIAPLISDILQVSYRK